VSTYSFMDIAATIVGPGGSFALGYGSGNSEEGITIEMVEDKETLTVGADGSTMHSLHAGNAGTVTLRFLKTSPINQKLAALYDFQRISSATWGNNTIVISDPARGDQISCRDVAFRRWPSVTYAKDGGMQEWSFNAGSIDGILGSGTPSLT
jgi:Protein of unknown function (DUF3277)